jgi:sensor domain CHASE-containing protein
MKRVLVFILPLLIVVSVIFAAFGIYQARSVQERLTDEVKRKAKAVAESMEMSAAQVLINGDIKKARRIVEKFEKRERLQGCIIYDDS